MHLGVPHVFDERLKHVRRVAARLLHNGLGQCWPLFLVLRVLPANHSQKEVDPTRLELVTSAMRGRRSPD